ncbi:DUF11 domain-containing protein [Rubripirellula reticaptiva]|uniref:DUF11 domain-containing protein n=1 Tax=Rubripirellula reticaptiva TaxID=2528013 RepID=A0A5C6F5F5_9BACT|nr:DUF11 domain-containing protein [Rubripirellula reticaptiva]TWU55637.1 hypothetical protein Poly59_19370 [Rubripirellula reticaptiva]
MKTITTLTLSLATTAVLVMTGCGVTSTKKLAHAPSIHMPAPQAVAIAPPAAMDSSPAAVAPQYANQAAAPNSKTNQSVSQVAFIGDLNTDVACPPETIFTEVPFEGTCQSCQAPAPQDCGGQGCGCQACEVVPHGYAMPNVPCVTGYDPQEFLCDGGDQNSDVFVRRDDTIGGLQPEDTVVHYTTEAGDIETNASNRVCVYAPRFSSVRKITGAVAGGHSIGLAAVDRPVGAGRVGINEGGVVIGETVELGHADVSRRIDAMRDRNRGVPVDSVLQPIQNVDVLALLTGLKLDQVNLLRDDQLAEVQRLALAAVAWTIDESVEVEIQDLKPPTIVRDQSVEGLTIYEFPEAGRLQVVKLADRADAKPGEVITFAIRVENVGDSAVDHVTLTDNLTTRLEYVVDSQTCSGGAEFSSVENDADSMQLVWNLTDKLRVGESVTVRFQCKVR